MKIMKNYELKVENVRLKKTLNKKNTLIECFEFEKNDLDEKLNFYGSQKIDMDCMIKKHIDEKENLI